MKTYFYAVLAITYLLTANLYGYQYTFINSTSDQFDIEVQLVGCLEGPLTGHIGAHQTITLATSHWYTDKCLMKSVALNKNNNKVFERQFGLESGALTLTSGDKQWTIRKNRSTGAYQLDGSDLY